MRTYMSRRLIVWSLAGLLVAGGVATAVGLAQQRASGQMATAANALLASLPADVKAKLSFPVASEEWTHWHFIPPSMFARNGVPLRDMPPASRQLARTC